MFQWNAALLTHLYIIYDCSGTTTETLSSCRDCVSPTTPKPFNVWPLQKNFSSLRLPLVFWQKGYIVHPGSGLQIFQSTLILPSSCQIYLFKCKSYHSKLCKIFLFFLFNNDLMMACWIPLYLVTDFTDCLFSLTCNPWNSTTDACFQFLC